MSRDAGQHAGQATASAPGTALSRQCSTVAPATRLLLRSFLVSADACAGRRHRAVRSRRSALRQQVGPRLQVNLPRLFYSGLSRDRCRKAYAALGHVIGSVLRADGSRRVPIMALTATATQVTCDV
jgi:hypothetical protein